MHDRLLDTITRARAAADAERARTFARIRAALDAEMRSHIARIRERAEAELWLLRVDLSMGPR